MSVVCDICWVVLGKTIDPLSNMKKIGIWEVCPTCYKMIEDKIFELVKSKEMRKN